MIRYVMRLIFFTLLVSIGPVFTGLVFMGALQGEASAVEVPLEAHCQLQDATQREVTSVDAFGVISMMDGTALKLADLFVPLDPETGKFPPRTLMRLRQMTKGAHAHIVTIGGLDRYGTHKAFVFLRQPQGDVVLLQERLIVEQLAVYMPGPAPKKPISTDCDLFALQMGLLELDQKHTISNQTKREDLVSVYTAENQRLWDLEGEFTIVRGTVTNMRKTRNGISLNFGDDWKRDFTAYLSVSVSKELEDRHDKNFNLVGQRIQMRGFMDLYYGPAMRIDHLLQMEILSK